MVLRWLAAAVVLLPFGCTKSDGSGDVITTTAGCIDQFASSKGYGYLTDPGVGSIATSPPNTGDAGTSPTQPISALAQAVSNCQTGASVAVVPVGGGGTAGGPDAAAPARQSSADCDPSKIITHDAAVCIARAKGLAEGAYGYAAGLVYNYGYRRIIWTVQNTLQSDANGKGGTVMYIDATTGQVLDTSVWQAMS